ncbi:MAG: type 1 glutamine amidotransferase [Rubrivivax sp.]
MSSPATSPLLIGISARIHYPIKPVPDLGGVYTKTLHYLEQSVAHWVMSRGVLALMIPPIEREGLIERSDMSLHAYAEALDGLVLQGGNDLAPQSYGETPLKPEWAGDAVRDKYEMQLVKAFIDLGKPIIGICRGHQLLNVYMGGTLYQDIATQLPGSIAHRNLEHYERQFHGMRLQSGTPLAALYPDKGEVAVNSIHHQAVKTLGRDLVAEAHSVPDGLVEALRWNGPSYVFGMQWHPEFMAQQTLHPEQLDGKPILNQFLNAVREHKARGQQ